MALNNSCSTLPTISLRSPVIQARSKDKVSRPGVPGRGDVKRHLSNAYAKMDVAYRGEDTVMALHEEWITITDITEDPDGPMGNGRVGP